MPSQTKRTYNIAVLPGDFIGPEVVDAALKVLDAVADAYALRFEYTRLPFGGNALESHGTPLPDETKEACAASDAVLMGAAGGPVGDHPWNRVPREKRVESGILGIRKHLGVFANLRPVRVFGGLEHLSPLKSEVAKGTDLLIIRELTGGVYFGKPSFVEADRGLSTMVYERAEVERIARVALEAARGARRGPHQRGQSQRARRVAVLARRGGGRARRRVRRRGARAPLRRQRRHANRPRPQSVQYGCDGQPLRGHPVGPGRGHPRLFGRAPPRPAWAARWACSSPSTAPPRTSRAKV